MEPFNPALDLVKQHGFWGLAGADGCACGECSVRGVEMSVSCRKSSGGYGDFWGSLIRVTSCRDDTPKEALVALARELFAQTLEMAPGLPTMVRFCSYEQDAAQKCVYCGEPRAALEAYLCVECEAKEAPYGGGPLAARYAWPTIFAEEEAA